MTVDEGSVCDNSEFKAGVVQMPGEFIELFVEQRFAAPENDFRFRRESAQGICDFKPFLRRNFAVFETSSEHAVLLSAENAAQIAASGQLEVN